MSQQRPSSPGFSFPSPGKTPSHPGSFADAVSHCKNAMKAYDPAVLRQAIRELWELTLVGSEYHFSFLCNTMYHRAPPGTLSHTMEQHGARLVQNSATAIAKHLRGKDLDGMAPILLPKFSPAFLDKALALRLESIQAQQLVHALGRAERLGYDARDMVTANTSGPARQERVIPTANPIPTPPAAMMPRASQAPPQPGPGEAAGISMPSDEEILRLGIAFCERCNRPCAGRQALESRFPGNMSGVRYHMKNAVCGHYTEEHADALRALFADADEVQKRLQPAVAVPRAAPAPSQGSPGQSPGSRDPYAALNPEQRRAFDAEMARADQKYADQLVKARLLPAEEQRAEFARVKNIYNTKQSVTRKKYGIRLRERRSRAEVEEERNRRLSSRHNTPGSTGTRSHSEVHDTPTPALRERRESVNPQGAAPRAAVFAETSNGLSGAPPGTAELTDQTSTSATSPAVSQPSPPGTAGAAARPMPMSIAGSYTAPVRAPDVPMSNNATDKQSIEIDDDDDAKMDTVGDDESNTEKEVDGQDHKMD
ncbi:hypothetical protein PWT90_09537 [Aphanocladium album]|nr:hypothetical protein PWT90_09537 [Aphanocladium album]